MRAAAALAAGAIVVLLVTQFGATVMRVEGISMESRLEPGAMVLVIRPFALRTAAWLRGGGWHLDVPVGAVVALSDPRPTAARTTLSGELLVKRVVAVGPASVAVVDGELLVDGAPQPEPWLDNELRGAVQLAARNVPTDAVFVLGDNRLPLASRDSRSFGPVPQAALRGRVVAVLCWPWSFTDGWRCPVVTPL